MIKNNDAIEALDYIYGLLRLGDVTDRTAAAYETIRKALEQPSVDVGEQAEEDRKQLLNLIMRDITELDYECHPDKEDAVNLIYDDLWKVIKAAIERAKEK